MPFRMAERIAGLEQLISAADIETCNLKRCYCYFRSFSPSWSATSAGASLGSFRTMAAAIAVNAVG